MPCVQTHDARAPVYKSVYTSWDIGDPKLIVEAGQDKLLLAGGWIISRQLVKCEGTRLFGDPRIARTQWDVCVNKTRASNANKQQLPKPCNFKRV